MSIGVLGQCSSVHLVRFAAFDAHGSLGRKTGDLSVLRFPISKKGQQRQRVDARILKAEQGVFPGNTLALKPSQQLIPSGNCVGDLFMDP
jgi:hypothetical protein